MAAMDSFLITVDGSEHEISTVSVRHLLDTSARFWLDLDGMDSSMADGLLRDTFGFHPLAVKDAEHFGQRPKIDPYDNFTLMVVYGATDSSRLVNRITSLPAFLGAGIGLQVAVAVALIVVFRRRGWLSADGTVPPARPADRPRATRQERWHVAQPVKEPARP
jgi:Mg2+ and Co2+ transporter CorA